MESHKNPPGSITPQELLLQTGLFDSLTHEELTELIDRMEYVCFSAGEIIVQEGTNGDKLYIIIDGEVIVYTESETEHQVVLARLSAKRHEYFGEQALLAENSKKRNASVRACGEVHLFCIGRCEFQALLSKDHPLKERLLNHGAHQLQEKLLRQSELFRSVVFEGAGDNWYREQVFADGEVVFRQGEPGDNVYFILSGCAEVYKTEETTREPALMMRLQRQQCFGELALLKRQPRNATIIAKGRLTVLCIDGEKFMELYEHTPEMRNYLQTLQKIYPLTGLGIVTQHSGTFMDMDAVTTVYQMLDGTTAIASQVIGRNIFTISITNANTETGECYLFIDDQQNLRRELFVDHNCIVSMNVQGEWSELGQICHMVIKQQPLRASVLRTFVATGSIVKKPVVAAGDDQIICYCMMVKLSTLQQLVARGYKDSDALSDISGAGTACGSCRPDLEQITGASAWNQVKLEKTIEVAENIRSFRFVSTIQEFQTAKPGQHIVVKALIDGNWAQRPYTISSAADETRYREITVKRELNGYFSNWLFDELDEQAQIFVSSPQGDYHANFYKKSPLVCLVAGIGITPALAICRTIIARNLHVPLYIDYSVSQSSQLAYAEELQIADKHEHIDVNLRVTGEQGRCKSKDIKLLVQKFPQGEYFICGPENYQHKMKKYLFGYDIAERRIHIEQFIPAGAEALSSKPRSLDWYKAFMKKYKKRRLPGMGTS